MSVKMNLTIFIVNSIQGPLALDEELPIRIRGYLVTGNVTIAVSSHLQASIVAGVIRPYA
jgi:hypothetical protein